MSDGLVTLEGVAGVEAGRAIAKTSKTFFYHINE
jgi:hypothetical protein